MIYSADSDIFIESWQRDFPPDVLPGFWDKVDELIADEHLRASEEVIREIERKDDDLAAWIKDRPNLSVPIDDLVQDAVTEILGTHPRLLDTRKNRSGGDPWVIALAKVNKCTVLTKERATGSARRPHIPDACAAYGIRCINVLDLMRERGWQF